MGDLAAAQTRCVITSELIGACSQPIQVYRAARSVVHVTLGLNWSPKAAVKAWFLGAGIAVDGGPP